MPAKGMEACFMSTDTYVPIHKAAALVGIDEARLRTAIKNGLIATFPNERDGRSKLVKLSDVEKLRLKRRKNVAKRRVCKYCRKEKSLSQFMWDNGAYRYICKLCRRKQQEENDHRRRYGVSSAQLQQLRAEANGLCMLCGKKPNGNKNILEIDHDHITGAVRGLLCHRCNVFVYAVNQSPEHARLLADKLVSYLERTGQ